MRSRIYTTAQLLRSVGLAITLTCLLATQLVAQSFTENFNNIATLTTSGWAQQNLSTPVGTVPNWFQGSAATFIAQSGPDSSYIGCNYNSVAGNATISNWLFTPVRTFDNGHTVSFWSRTVDTPTYPDRLEVRLSTNGSSVNVGTTSTSVGDFTTVLLTINPTLTTTGYPNIWTQYTITVSGLAAPTTGRLGFRYFVTSGGPSGNNSDYIGIDNFVYTAPVSGDLQMAAADTIEYTITPEDHQWPGPYTGKIKNNGTTTINNAFMQVNVYDGLGTQVYTANSAISATIAPGAVVNKTVPVATGLTSDFYTIEYIAKHSAADGNPLDDTLYNGILVDPSTYARDNGNVLGALGIGAGNGGYLGQTYHLYQADQLDSIFVFVTAGYTGEPMAAVVWNIVSGQPGSIIGSTDTLIYPSDAASTYMLPMHGGSLSLPAGDFAVTFVEFDSTVQLGQTDEVFRNGTTWVNWPTSPAGGWANNEFFGVPSFNRPYVIRPILSLCPAYVANMASTQSGCAAATGTATIAVTGGAGPFTYLWSNGQSTATATNLPAGTYSVTATDANGCSVSGSTSVTNPNAPSATVAATPALCNGTQGGATATVTGGTAPYTYLWSNAATTATISANAGSYSVTIIDASGCQTSAGPAVITQPATAVSATVTSTQESTPGANDASATAVATGGTSPYTYSWSNGATTATVTGLGAGSYTVTITDANGCTTTGNTSVIVGIENINGLVSFGAFPNPNDGTFQIVIGAVEPSDINVDIVDMVGKVVYSTSATYATEFKREVNLRGEAAGIYFIRMKAGDISRTYKIEVKH